MINVVDIIDLYGKMVVDVIVRGGVLNAAFTNVGFVDGFTLKKAPGNINLQVIEVGDFITGFIDDTTWVAAKVLALPYTNRANLDIASEGQIF
jgi:hypothetical protein